VRPRHFLVVGERIRSIVGGSLEALGQVDSAATTSAALDKIGAGRRSVTGMFIDVELPEGAGFYVLDAALLIELDIPTMFVTTDRDQSKFDRDMEEARLRETGCMKASRITRAHVKKLVAIWDKIPATDEEEDERAIEHLAQRDGVSIAELRQESEEVKRQTGFPTATAYARCYRRARQARERIFGHGSKDEEATDAARAMSQGRADDSVAPEFVRPFNSARLTATGTDRTPEPDDDLPGVVMKACVEAGERAKAYTDYERRRHLAILAFDCDDPRTHDLIRAVGVASGGQPLEPVPHKAVTAILQYVTATGLARALGYPDLPDLPEPGPGKMRMVVFARGGAQAGPFLIEDAAVVAPALEERAKAGAAFAARIADEKHALIARAVGIVLSKPGLRDRQVVVVFGSRSETFLAIYHALAALPAQVGFPPELPPGVPVIAVDRDEFRRVLDDHHVEPPRLDPAELGMNQVWVATFVEPRGVFVQRTESVPLARGGVA
jgi:hypothetical protein